MGFSRKSTTPTQEVVENLSHGVAHLRDAGVAAARTTKDAAAPKVNLVLTKVGLRKEPNPKWPWVAGAIGAGLVVGGAIAYLLYSRRNAELGEALLADELLDDTDGPNHPEFDSSGISDELVDSVTR